eukprot:scaffold3335_cov139-Skeletonema_marinoi.AAC.12
MEGEEDQDRSTDPEEFRSPQRCLNPLSGKPNLTVLRMILSSREVQTRGQRLILRCRQLNEKPI